MLIRKDLLAIISPVQDTKWRFSFGSSNLLRLASSRITQNTQAGRKIYHEHPIRAVFSADLHHGIVAEHVSVVFSLRRPCNSTRSAKSSRRNHSRRSNILDRLLLLCSSLHRSANSPPPSPAPVSIAHVLDSAMPQLFWCP